MTVGVALIVDDEGTARTLASLEGNASLSVHERRNLDGRAAEWIVVGGVAIRSLKMILDGVLRYVELNRVKSIKIGEIEIERPRPEDVDRLIERHANKLGAADDG